MHKAEVDMGSRDQHRSTLDSREIGDGQWKARYHGKLGACG